MARPSTLWREIGGEEFALALPETGYARAMDAARRLRAIACSRSSPKNTDRMTSSFRLRGLVLVCAGERRLVQRQRARIIGENALTLTQALAGARRLPARAASVHILMHKFCG